MIKFPILRQCAFRSFSFCNMNDHQKNLEQQGKSLESKNEEQHLKKQSLDIKDYIRNAIVVEKQRKSEQIRPKEEYRAAILFEDLLNKETIITVYDTHGRVYWMFSTWYLLGFLFGCFGISQIFKTPKWHKKSQEYCKLVITIAFLGSRLFLYRRLYRLNVEKVLYNTKNSLFTITKRNIFGRIKSEDVQRDKLLYTSDQILNSRKVNYLNIETLECYSIAYTYGWINKELFSHILEQNLKK